MSTYSAATTTSKNLVILGLLFFFLRIQSRVDAREGVRQPPFITPEFAIPEMADNDELFLFDDTDSSLLKKRRPFFRQTINWGINNILNRPGPIPPPSPPATPPSPVPGTKPLVVEEETDNTSNVIINERLEKNVPTMNERDDDVTIDETIQQSDTSSSSPSSETTTRQRYFSFANSGGRLGFEVQSSTVNGSKRKRSTTTATTSTVSSPSAAKPTTSRQIRLRSMGTATSDQMSTTKTTTTVADTDAIELSFDASSIWNLAILIANGTATTGVAVLGTLRLLAPMLLARRVLLYLLNMASDWYTGRYEDLLATRSCFGGYIIVDC